MKIRSIAIRNFRNIEAAHLDFTNHINVLVGDNGQGKTNLLESIVYLSYGKSFRVNDDQMLIQNEKKFSDIKAVVEGNNSQELRVVLSDEGKFLSVDHKPIVRLSEFIGKINVVLFQPDDLQFFTQTPRKRRRDLDYEIGKLSPQYMHALSTCTRLIQERNGCLKSQHVDEAYLAVLNEMIAKESVFILKSRFALVEALNPLIEKAYHALGNSGKVALSYVSFIKNASEVSIETILKRFEENQRRDRDFRQTHVGVHRDDFMFMVDELAVVHRLSQGQRRLLIVAYKLALIELIHKKTGTYPIFCMDDLLSELDETRRQLVLKQLPDALQCLITTTDMGFLQGEFRDIRVFTVKDGKVEGGNKNE